MNPKSEQSFPGIAIIGWAATALAIAAVALLAVNAASRGEYFYWKLAWVEVLALLAWSPALGLLQMALAGRGSASGMGGIIPASITALVTYSVISASIVILANWGGRIQLIVQVVLFLGLVFALLGLQAARQGAKAESAVAPNLRRPESLVAELKSIEDRLSVMKLDGSSRPLYEGIRSFREQMQYSFPRLVRPSMASEYGELAVEIEKLCAKLAGLPPSAVGHESGPILAGLADLQRRVKLCAAGARVSAQ